MDAIVKVLVVGDAKAGKTTLCKRLQQGANDNLDDPDLDECPYFLCDVSLAEARQRCAAAVAGAVGVSQASLTSSQAEDADFDSCSDCRSVQLQLHDSKNADRQTLQPFLFNHVALTIYCFDAATTCIEDYVMEREGAQRVDTGADDSDAAPPSLFQLNLEEWYKRVHVGLSRFTRKVDPAKVPLVVFGLKWDLVVDGRPAVSSLTRRAGRGAAAGGGSSVDFDAERAHMLRHDPTYPQRWRESRRAIALRMGFHELFLVSNERSWFPVTEDAVMWAANRVDRVILSNAAVREEFMTQRGVLLSDGSPARPGGSAANRRKSSCCN